MNGWTFKTTNCTEAVITTSCQYCLGVHSRSIIGGQQARGNYWMEIGGNAPTTMPFTLSGRHSTVITWLVCATRGPVSRHWSAVAHRCPSPIMFSVWQACLRWTMMLMVVAMDHSVRCLHLHHHQWCTTAGQLLQDNVEYQQAIKLVSEKPWNVNSDFR